MGPWRSVSRQSIGSIRIIGQRLRQSGSQQSPCTQIPSATLAMACYSSVARRRSEPRIFPATGFTTIDSDLLVEEEGLPDYDANYFYPVKMGEVFVRRYQVVSKLGWGTSSTIWLARDLE